jgi:hypothetical protein
MTVSECALLMGKSPHFVRCGLRCGLFPFGIAVKMSSKWCYYVNDLRFYKYMEGV